ncbi:MAG: 4-hydroxy-tetrahydrodipicolinate synthase [Solirubrobacterales bacterium]|nr:4-hydroxy-tetrahydrodipicolinate synthase [Solirubrobacterales bacterium]
MSDLGAIITAMVTPFDADGRVDDGAAVALMHFLLNNGSDGVVIAGTTGEGSSLQDEEHLGLIDLAVGEVGGQMTVIASTGSNDTRHAVALTERATELGADGILSVAPYYVRPNRRGMVRHYQEIAKATDKPVILYNIPVRTGIDIPNDLCAELAQIEHIDALKQARSTDVAMVDGLALYAGNDEMVCDVLELGGAGGICVASHLVGKEMRRMVDEPEHRREIDASLHEIYEAMGVTTNPIPVKKALALCGHQVGGLRLPLVEADEEETAAIAGALTRHGLLQAAR